jgi:hypothetical protein
MKLKQLGILIAVVLVLALIINYANNKSDLQEAKK